MSDLTWFVIYTKPRSEKKVAERLNKNGIEAYCPLVKTLRVWSDRKKKVKVPMFTSYVFVRINEVDRYQVLEDPGVLNFVFWLGKPATVKDREIEAIKKISEGGEEVDVANVTFEKGQVVEIPDGPFRGLTGKIIDLSKNVIMVYIEQLGCKIQFKYTKRDLERK